MKTVQVLIRLTFQTPDEFESADIYYAESVADHLAETFNDDGTLRRVEYVEWETLGSFALWENPKR